MRVGTVPFPGVRKAAVLLDVENNATGEPGLTEWKIPGSNRAQVLRRAHSGTSSVVWMYLPFRACLKECVFLERPFWCAIQAETARRVSAVP